MKYKAHDMTDDSHTQHTPPPLQPACLNRFAVMWRNGNREVACDVVERERDRGGKGA